MLRRAISTPEFTATVVVPEPLLAPKNTSVVDDWRAHQTVIDCMVRLPNVHADTSGVRRFDYLLEAVRRAGAHKLLFGIQAYENVDPDSLAEVTSRFESSALKVYDINPQARNPGLLLGTVGWVTSSLDVLDGDIPTTDAGGTSV